MAQPKRWLDEIVDVLQSLGGIGHLSDIYNAIESRGIMNLHETWQASVRRTIESHSSDCDAFYGKEDLFYSVFGKGKGVWGLRNYVPSYVTTEIKKSISKVEEREVEYFLENDSEEAFEIFLDRFNSEGSLIVKEGLIKIRKASKKIIDMLKSLYENKCQLCREDFFSQHGVSIVEAHHIEYFSKTQNHHPSNILILCPNHHRLVHLLNATFDREQKQVIYSNGIKENLMINKHL